VNKMNGQEKRKQMGMYIHIPFCIKKCDYCDFLSAPADDKTQDIYVHALLKEIEVRSRMYRGHEIATIFFGGGTPSCIDEKHIISILNTIYQNFQVCSDAEISIEVNPGTVNPEKLLGYYQAGINRLSIGLQSVRESELHLLGRIHTYDDFCTTYDLARQVGFSNINVDLISALPNQTLAEWMESLIKVVELSPEHISAYSLIIEPDTPFARRYQMDGISESQLDAQDELERLMYHQTEVYLEQHGYRHYEISNYAKQGRECRHNKSYWTGIPYLGLGLGAASYEQTQDDHYVRRKNLEKLSEYIEFWQSWQKAKHRQLSLSFIFEEILTVHNRMEEFMFLGLRMMEGVSVQAFESEFKQSYNEIYGVVTNQMIRNQLLLYRNVRGETRLCLTEHGIDVSNYVMSEFLLL
jgi:oxygen-independent coproporphyrinogen-3 oxidase